MGQLHRWRAASLAALRRVKSLAGRIAADDARFKNLSQGILSLLLAIAIPIGGGWAVYEYVSTSKSTRAQIELQQLMDTRPSINTTLSVSLRQLPAVASGAKKRTFLHIIVTLANESGLSEDIFIQNPPVVVRNVFDPKEEIDVRGALEDRTGALAGAAMALSGGAAMEHQFVAEIDEPGLYLVSFEAFLSLGNSQRAMRRMAIESRDWVSQVPEDLRNDLMKGATLDVPRYGTYAYYFVDSL